jgi:sporulation-control protein spo0M
MSFFEQMGAAVGIGAARVEIILQGTEHAWNDKIRGTLIVHGGTVEQTASEVRVSVVEHWETRDSDGDEEDHYRHYSESVLATEARIPAGATQQWEFEVQVPEGAAFAHDWYVEGRVCVARAADRYGKMDFNLVPPPAAMGLGAALGEVAPFVLRSVGNAGTDLLLDFRPPQHLEGVLDGVMFIVSLVGDQIAGFLEINPQERSFGDHLKALVHKDRVKHPIEFPAAPLAENPHGPAPREVVSKLREILQPYLG